MAVTSELSVLHRAVDELRSVEAPAAAEVQVIDDRPLDPSLWADADDEGLGGYHRGASR